MGQFRETAVEKQLENFASMIFMKAKQMILLEPTLQRAVSSEIAFLIPGCCQRTRDSQKWARRIPGWWWRVGIPGESVIILKATEVSIQRMQVISPAFWLCWRID